ncbi:hypothetical protein QP794_07420 [Paenibacillus sp. UMB7766-LJ446]|uniref:hypothetical protein n=1 Tax=Paenibacillus sp. UMB7766-LJ446 TaxID=3046313 RepID=UPI002550AE16|nr:hypothetical protein [Paenibacillus sp. UMB7766-LJ446]MDK8189912.1 hypothetical protein [Paenibacillus sp. UMB7766-LJ446]
MDETRLADVERRTAWLRDGRFGIMVHWLSSTQPRTGVSIKDWNRKVDSFRLDDFWRQF